VIRSEREFLFKETRYSLTPFNNESHNNPGKMFIKSSEVSGEFTILLGDWLPVKKLKRHSSMVTPNNLHTAKTPSMTPAVKLIRTVNPIQSLDDKKRAFVLEAIRKHKLRRRQVMEQAMITDFRAMNYWLRGKELTRPMVGDSGRLLYEWASVLENKFIKNDTQPTPEKMPKLSIEECTHNLDIDVKPHKPEPDYSQVFSDSHDSKHVRPLKKGGRKTNNSIKAQPQTHHQLYFDPLDSPSTPVTSSGTSKPYFAFPGSEKGDDSTIILSPVPQKGGSGTMMSPVPTSPNFFSNSIFSAGANFGSPHRAGHPQYNPNSPISMYSPTPAHVVSASAGFSLLHDGGNSNGSLTPFPATPLVPDHHHYRTSTHVTSSFAASDDLVFTPNSSLRPFEVKYSTMAKLVELTSDSELPLKTPCDYDGFQNGTPHYSSGSKSNHTPAIRCLDFGQN